MILSMKGGNGVNCSFTPVDLLSSWPDSSCNSSMSPLLTLAVMLGQMMAGRPAFIALR